VLEVWLEARHDEVDELWGIDAFREWAQGAAEQLPLDELLPYAQELLVLKRKNNILDADAAYSLSASLAPSFSHQLTHLRLFTRARPPVSRARGNVDPYTALERLGAVYTPVKGKTPMVKDWQRTPIELQFCLANPRATGAGLVIDTYRDGIVCLDIDADSKKGYEEALQLVPSGPFLRVDSPKQHRCKLLYVVSSPLLERLAGKSQYKLPLASGGAVELFLQNKQGVVWGDYPGGGKYTQVVCPPAAIGDTSRLVDAVEASKVVPLRDKTAAINVVPPAALSRTADIGAVAQTDNYSRAADIIAAAAAGGYVLDDYGSWIEIGMSLVDSLGDRGRDLYHQISMTSGKYDRQVVDDKYDDLVTNSRGNHTIGTLLHLLGHHAKQGGSGKKDKRTVYHHMRSYIADRYSLRYNTVDRCITDANGKEQDIEQLVDDAKDNAPARCQAALGAVREIIIALARSLPYNPIKEYVDRLPSPAKDPTVAVCDYLRIKPNALRSVVRKWLINMLLPIYRPGAVNELVLALVGHKQGTGKTYALNNLLPPALQRYVVTGRIDDDKDSLLEQCRRLLYVDDEYAGWTRRDIAVVKRAASQVYVTKRAPYARTSETLPRLATFAITCQSTNILTESAQRRYVIVEITDRLDWQQFATIDRDALLAYSRDQLLSGGYNHSLEEAEYDHIMDTNADHMMDSVVGDLIAKRLRKTVIETEMLTLADIVAHLGKEPDIPPLQEHKIAAALRQAGYSTCRVTRRGGKVRVWDAVSSG